MTKQTVITFDEDGTDYITGESVSFTLNNAEELCQHDGQAERDEDSVFIPQ